MSLLTEFNAAIAPYFPIWIWDWLQILFGAAVAIATVVQRSCSPRFQTSKIACPADAITTRLAQIGLAVVGAAAALVAIDGLLPPPAPPRAFVILFLAAYFCVQLRIIYEAISKRFARPPSFARTP